MKYKIQIYKLLIIVLFITNLNSRLIEKIVSSETMMKADINQICEDSIESLATTYPHLELRDDKLFYKRFKRQMQKNNDFMYYAFRNNDKKMTYTIYIRSEVKKTKVPIPDIVTSVHIYLHLFVMKAHNIVYKESALHSFAKEKKYPHINITVNVSGSNMRSRYKEKRTKVEKKTIYISSESLATNSSNKVFKTLIKQIDKI